MDNTSRYETICRVVIRMMKEIFGLEDKYLLCETNEEYG